MKLADVGVLISGVMGLIAVWRLVLWHVGKLEENMKDLESRVHVDVERVEESINRAQIEKELLKEAYMSKNEHEHICKIANLEMKEHITKEMTQLKDELFTQLRKMEGMIRQNGNPRNEVSALSEES